MDYWGTNLIIRRLVSSDLFTMLPPRSPGQLSGLDIPWIIGRGRDHWHDNFHAPPCVMKWHFYCIIFTELLVSLLYIVIYYHLWKEIFSPLRICSRHPVIATLHNSWQNYGRKLAHNYAHSKVILNVYLADFFHSILVGFWLFINESFLLGVLKCQYWEVNKNPAAFQEV